jgi:hypothetical protein
MEERINVAEILKDCPFDMELNCLMYDDVYFDYVDEFDMIHCYIQWKTHKTSLTFNQYGTPNSVIKSKCVIFPKGKTTWEGFHRPFKDGDIIHVFDEYSDETFTYLAILKQIEKGGKINSHCFYNYEDDEFSTHDFLYDGYNIRLATEEEKQKLFKVIKDNGYEWDPETKTLEKLVVPKFNVGDTITNGDVISVIKQITKDSYILDIKDCDICFNYVFFKDQDKWKLIPNKFDITTLNPFDKVLVRDFDNTPWEIEFFSRLLDGKYFKCLDVSYIQCIPYEGNEHLLGTTNDCDGYYKTWK